MSVRKLNKLCSYLLWDGTTIDRIHFNIINSGNDHLRFFIEHGRSECRIAIKIKVLSDKSIRIYPKQLLEITNFGINIDDIKNMIRMLSDWDSFDICQKDFKNFNYDYTGLPNYEGDSNE
jgi:3-methyladenine DNA glycosylase AlkD